jgi:nucleoside-diphosphate-sugar epimerase
MHQAFPGLTLSLVHRRGSVHIDDLTELYICLLNRLYSGAARVDPLPSGWEGTFIGSAQEVTWGAISKEIGKCLKQQGLISTEEVTSFSEDELEAMNQVMGRLAGKLLGANSRASAVRAKRDLGWKPSCPPAEKCVAGDVEDYLRNTGEL